MALKNLSRKKVYKFSLTIILLFQVLMLFTLPFFIFYKLEFINGSTKSFYLNSFHWWSYFMILWTFSLFGLVVNIINLKIKNNRHIIHAAIIIFSCIPSIIFVLFAIQLFKGDPKITEKNPAELANNKLILKIGKTGLLAVNLISLGMIIMMYVGPFLLILISKNSVNSIKYDFESVVTTIIIGSLTVFNLLLILSSYVLKNRQFDTYLGFITIFTSFLPIIVGSIFGILIIVSLRKNLKILQRKKVINYSENLI